MAEPDKCPACGGLMSLYAHRDSPIAVRHVAYIDYVMRSLAIFDDNPLPQVKVGYETFDVCNRCYSDASGNGEKLWNQVQFNKHRTYHMGVDFGKYGSDKTAITFLDAHGNMVGRIQDDPAAEPLRYGLFNHWRLKTINPPIDPDYKPSHTHYMQSASISSITEHPTVGMLRKLRKMVEEGGDPAASIWQASAQSERGETTDPDGYEGLMKVLTEVAKGHGESSWSRFVQRHTTDECLRAIDDAVKLARGLGVSPFDFFKRASYPQRISLDTVKESDAGAEASGRERMKRERQRAREELDREWEELMEGDK